MNENITEYAAGKLAKLLNDEGADGFFAVILNDEDIVGVKPVKAEIVASPEREVDLHWLENIVFDNIKQRVTHIGMINSSGDLLVRSPMPAFPGDTITLEKYKEPKYILEPHEYSVVAEVAAELKQRDELIAALEAMVEEQVDYMTLNNLGDPYRQDTIKRARAALAKAKGGDA